MDAKPGRAQHANDRSDRNRRSYKKSKAHQDHVLLRLEKGDVATLDAASAAVGVSRAAFARMFLLPILSAVASRIPEIEKARAERGESFRKFLESAISSSLANGRPGVSSVDAADEFDALFGPAGGDD